MMDQVIKDFPSQFLFKPELSIKTDLNKYKKYIVCGMGGSHLAADIIKNIDPEVDLVIHSDYGLPHIPSDQLDKCLFIFSSYSGNTEETIDGYRVAKSKNLPRIVVTVGGILLELAKKDKIPFIKIPNTGIQPRNALGYSFMALLSVMQKDAISKQAIKTAEELTLQMTNLNLQGKDLADEIAGFVPLIIASTRNYSLAYNWKIKFNETGKIPAFYNLIPELNHNEMTGFDLSDNSRYLADRFYILFLLDDLDHYKNRKRMEVLYQLYHEKRLPVKNIFLTGNNILVKVFSSLILADWTAYYLAKHFNHEAEKVPMVEEFKKRINH